MARKDLNGHAAWESNVAQVREKGNAMVRLVRPLKESTKFIVCDLALRRGQQLPSLDKDIVAFRYTP